MSVPISNLPIPNLDDRRFDDLMKEARSLILNYDRDWTNHNPSDPGITLLELFAWLSEMVMYRMNQVTVESYTNFLKLIAGTQNKDDLEKILESTYLFDWNDFKPDGEIRLRNFLKTELGLDWVTNYDNAKIIKHDQSYFFSWNDVPGNDDKILTSFLKMRFGIDWVEKSIIVKNYHDDTYDETIKLSSGDKFVSLGLKKEEKKVRLITDDGRTDEFVLMEGEDKLNVYNPSIKTLNISSGKKWIEIKVDEIEGKGNLNINGCKVRYLHSIKENGGLNIYNMPDLDGAYKNLLNFLVEINDGKKKSISEIKQAPVEFMESMYRAITSEDYKKRAQDCMKILLQKDPPGRAVCMTNRKLLYSKGIEEYGVNEELPGHVSVIIIPRGVEDSYLFRWDEIPGNDNGKLAEFLEQKYG
ncbi:MAG: hypothetical protein O8C66_04265, partial [Candidatus Methanoperedens sp.]|nr:hypothetical protein [Candidatus Methanoperedens sp.]